MIIETADPPPHEIEALLEQRRRNGLDGHDEIWEGTLFMAPHPRIAHADIQAQLLALLSPLARARGLKAFAEFNLGEPDNFRVPDAGIRPAGPNELYLTTAALAAEIISPGDRTWQKLPFDAAHHVDELLIIDPETHGVDWLALGPDGEYKPTEQSSLIELGPKHPAAQIDWPPTSD